MIRYHILIDAAYEQERFAQIQRVEGTIPTVYMSAGDPTIGIGFNLSARDASAAVARAFGIDPENQDLDQDGRAREQEYLDEIIATGKAGGTQASFDAIMRR